MLLLDHVAYLQDGQNLVIVASKGGSPRHPAWLHNLCANPHTTVQVGHPPGFLFGALARESLPELINPLE